jgi:hypothetical protein
MRNPGRRCSCSKPERIDDLRTKQTVMSELDETKGVLLRKDVFTLIWGSAPDPGV